MESTLQEPALGAAEATIKGKTIISNADQRRIFRWIHILVSIPIYGYIYSPFDKLPQYAHITRFVFFPIMVLTGVLMWKGHVVGRLISKRSA